jgi:hypothetical protein
MNSTGIVEAKQFLDPDGGIVESAARLGDEVARRLRDHEVVTIELRDMRGLSSSYFNVLLQKVLPVTMPRDFARRVILHFDSPAQEEVFKRSLEFANRALA